MKLEPNKTLEPKYRTCTKCGGEFPATLEYFYRMESGKYGLMAICKRCKINYTYDYRKENRNKYNKYQKNYYNKNKEKLIPQKLKSNKRYKQSEKGKLTSKNYRKTKRYKLSMKRIKAERKRNFGWILFMENPFPEEIDIDYHHINNMIVIPLPRRTHKYYHNPNQLMHRDKCSEVIKYLYSIDFDKLLGEVY